VNLFGLSSGHRIPESDGLIVAAGDESSAVRTVEENLLHTTSVTIESDLVRKTKVSYTYYFASAIYFVVQQFLKS
jgi:hypothetical protein